MNHGDTIVAISSAAGPAPRMILRVGGPGARAAAGGVCAEISGDFEAGARRAMVTAAGVEFAAWVYSFVGPNSYTGEDLIEFHIPGNVVLARMVLEERSIALSTKSILPS